MLCMSPLHRENQFGFKTNSSQNQSMQPKLGVIYGRSPYFPSVLQQESGHKVTWRIIPFLRRKTNLGFILTS